MGRFDVLTQLDKKPGQSVSPIEKPTNLQESKLRPQDLKDTRIQEIKTPRVQEVKQSSTQDLLTPRPLDPKGTRPQEIIDRRIIKTHSYEFYVDQVELIRDIAYEDKKNGGKGSASQFVRDAIDEYLQKRGYK